MEMKSWKQVKKELLRNPEFRRTYEASEPEYQLARSLIAARIKRDLTQAQLAKKVGTKQSAISRIENMTSLPSVSTLKEISRALKIPLEIRFRS
ncbi:MAG: helix-turn-helix transcriptional regulator [Patescibacteria group bacterium]